jgi:hypothetical protein
MLELCDLSDPSKRAFHMVLPEGIVLSPDYVRFYRESAGYKILDNGIVEGRQYTGVELHHMAYEVGAQCIVVPDAFRNADTTIRLARDFERHRNPDNFKLHALGGSPWIREVSSLDDYGCDSMDTSLPVVLGLEGFGLHHEYINRKPDFMEQDVDRNSLRWRQLVDNCNLFHQWAGSGSTET